MYKRIVLSVFLVLLLLTTWQIIEDKVNISRLQSNQTALEAFIPTPKTIAKTFSTDWRDISREIRHTLIKAYLGLIIGLIFALLMASLFLFFPFLRNLFFPLSFAINSFPIIGFAPVVVLIFGQGSYSSIIFIAALICYFPILISLDTAFRQTDKDLLEFANIINASKWQTFSKIHFPLAIPYLNLSLKLAIPASIIGATIGEWLGSRYGIGQLITIALYQLKPGLLYSSLVSITLVSTVSVLALQLFEHIYFPWIKKSLRR